MSYEQEPVNEADQTPEELEQHQLLIYQTAEQLELYAEAANPEYGEFVEGTPYNVSDMAHVTKVTSELGGDLVTRIAFTAERVRETMHSKAERPVTYGEAITNRYVINSEIRRKNLRLEAFPTDLQQYLRHAEIYPAELMSDPDTDFAIAFTVAYELTTDGAFESEMGLKFYMDEVEISMIDIDGLDDEEPAEEDSFEAMFGEEDRLALQGVAKKLTDDFVGTNALELFQKQLPNLQFASTAHHLQMAENIVSWLVEAEEEKAA